MIPLFFLNGIITQQRTRKADNHVESVWRISQKASSLTSAEMTSWIISAPC